MPGRRLADAIDDDASDELHDRSDCRNLSRLQKEADDKARAALNAISGGPIYQAGVAEWMAKSAVTDAADGYNKAVVDGLRATQRWADDNVLSMMTYDDYVPLAND